MVFLPSLQNSKQTKQVGVHQIEEMYHHHPDSRLLNANTFKALRDYQNEAIYRAELYRLAGIIEEKMRAFIKEKQINFLACITAVF